VPETLEFTFEWKAKGSIRELYRITRYRQDMARRGESVRVARFPSILKNPEKERFQ
jgi:hypothetical protein